MSNKIIEFPDGNKSKNPPEKIDIPFNFDENNKRPLPRRGFMPDKYPTTYTRYTEEGDEDFVGNARAGKKYKPSQTVRRRLLALILSGSLLFSSGYYFGSKNGNVSGKTQAEETLLKYFQNNVPVEDIEFVKSHYDEYLAFALQEYNRCINSLNSDSSTTLLPEDTNEKISYSLSKFGIIANELSNKGYSTKITDDYENIIKNKLSYSLGGIDPKYIDIVYDSNGNCTVSNSLYQIVYNKSMISNELLPYLELFKKVSPEVVRYNIDFAPYYYPTSQEYLNGIAMLINATSELEKMKIVYSPENGFSVEPNEPSNDFSKSDDYEPEL